MTLRGATGVPDRAPKDAPRSSGPTLRGRHVHLRTILVEDYPYLQRAESAERLGGRDRLRGRTPSPVDWTQSAWQGVLAQFLVVANRDESRIGLVRLSDANFQDGHAQLAATRFSGRGRSPLMMLGLALFIEYAFRCWNFRKLYVDLPEYELPAIESGSGRLFNSEARLREHRYFDGQLWDELILAIYREDWHEHSRPLLRMEQGG